MERGDVTLQDESLKKKKRKKPPAISNQNVSKTTSKPHRNLAQLHVEKAALQVSYLLKVFYVLRVFYILK